MNTQHKAGLLLLGLLSVADLAMPLLTDGEHPPMWVALVSLGLGAASLAFLVPAWRGQWPGLAGLFATRLVSALLTLPAFFLSGVPAAVVVVSGVTVALTVLGILLALAGTRQAVAA